MPLLVTLHVYSQSPDPTWILSEEQARDFVDRCRSLPERTPLKARAIASRLGYRGFSVQSVPRPHLGEVRFAIDNGIVDVAREEMSYFDRDRHMESWLFGTAPGEAVEGLSEHVQEALSRSAEEVIDEQRQALVVQPHVTACAPRAADAPVFDERKWTVGISMSNNNCYNYIHDQVRNEFSRPGRSHGVAISSACPVVEAAAEADGLVHAAGFDQELGPGEGWYVALAVWPGRDSHWYRQDADGCWSHKLGQDEVSRKDNLKMPIVNPWSCDRRPYVNFCTFMIVRRDLRIA